MLRLAISVGYVVLLSYLDLLRRKLLGHFGGLGWLHLLRWGLFALVRVRLHEVGGLKSSLAGPCSSHSAVVALRCLLFEVCDLLLEQVVVVVSVRHLAVIKKLEICQI